MATFRHVRLGPSLINRINLLVTQSSCRLEDFTGKNCSALNSTQKRCFSQTNYQKLTRVGISSSQFISHHECGLLPTWSVYSRQMQRHKSTDTASDAAKLPDAPVPPPTLAAESGVSQQAEGYIPEPPVATDAIDLSQTLNAIGEPSLSSLGLGSYFPPGLIQHGLEILHVYGGLPWWSSIIVATAILRTMTLPLTILSQRNVAKMHNIQPRINELKKQYDDTLLTDNQIEKMIAKHEYVQFLKDNNVNPLKAAAVPMGLGMVMVSVFMGIRKMTYLPVESMKEGGILWFTDLTACDPYYILPVLVAGTLALTIEVGADGVAIQQMGKNVKIFMRVLPFVIFLFTLNFPSALCCYWFTSNLISLGIVGLLKNKTIKQKFKIPEKLVHPEKPQKKKQGFFTNIKEEYTASKNRTKVMNTWKDHEAKFKKAGQGPLQKTYSYNPTKRKHRVEI